MKARITIICENSVSVKGGIGEHGFAAFLETERGNYLFDTGRGEGLMGNLWPSTRPSVDPENYPKSRSL